MSKHDAHPMRERRLLRLSLANAVGLGLPTWLSPTMSGQTAVIIIPEYEEGLADCVAFPKAYEQPCVVIFDSPAIIIEGTMQRMGQGISIIARKIKRPTFPDQTIHRTPSRSRATRLRN